MNATVCTRIRSVIMGKSSRASAPRGRNQPAFLYACRRIQEHVLPIEPGSSRTFASRVDRRCRCPSTRARAGTTKAPFAASISRKPVSPLNAPDPNLRFAWQRFLAGHDVSCPRPARNRRACRSASSRRPSAAARPATYRSWRRRTRNCRSCCKGHRPDARVAKPAKQDPATAVDEILVADDVLGGEMVSEAAS